MTVSVNDLDNEQVQVNATIPNGAALSNIIDLQGFTLIGMTGPTAWTAATLSFQVSFDGVTFKDLTVSGSILFGFTAPQNFGYEDLAYDFGQLIGGGLGGVAAYMVWPRFIRLRSQTNNVNVNQGAARSFTLNLAPNIMRKP